MPTENPGKGVLRVWRFGCLESGGFGFRALKTLNGRCRVSGSSAETEGPAP